MKKIFKILTSRTFLFMVGIGAQVAWMTIFAMFIYNRFAWVEVIIRVITVCLVLYIVNKRIDPAYRLAWTLLILMLPIFGVVVYLLYGNSRLKTKLRKQFFLMQETGADRLRENTVIRGMINDIDPDADGVSAYIRNVTGFPLYVNRSAKYYRLGDDVLPDLLEALASAKMFIFMEYYIIAPGVFWDKIHKILIEKVKEGIDVRVIYDDFGCPGTITGNLRRKA